MSIDGEIQDIESKRITAVVNLDLDILDRLFDDELIYVHGNALVHRKTELLDYIEKGPRFRQINRAGLVVREVGQCALMTGLFDAVIQPVGGGDVREIHTFVTQVFRRSNEAWKMISFHASMRPSA